MSQKERLKKRPVTSVEYSASAEGAHIRVNGFAEFTITKEVLAKLNGIVFEKEIKENEDKSNTSEQG